MLHIKSAQGGQRFMRSFGRFWVVAASTAIVSAVLATASSTLAQVKPGDFITDENAAKVRDLVPPGQYLRITHGMSLKIIPTERIDWPPPYKEATEKYSAQVRLSNDGRSMVGYVAGQPFPDIDDNDPMVAVKIMWDNVFRPITSDDYDLRFFNCQSQYVRPGSSQNVIEEIQVGHYESYDLIGRAA